jgi:hypothetical protein
MRDALPHARFSAEADDISKPAFNLVHQCRFGILQQRGTVR